MNPSNPSKGGWSDMQNAKSPAEVGDRLQELNALKELARQGFLFGGSTGTVVSGAMTWLKDNRPTGEITAVAIAPDLGDRYLDTIYTDQWVTDIYGPDALGQEVLPEAIS